MKNIGCCCCLASEYAKLVINRCIDKGISLSNIKLQKLLIIMQGVMYACYNEPLFKQNITGASYGLALKEVNKDFLADFEFKEKYFTYIVPLDKEKKVIDEVLNIYGKLDVFELNNLPVMQQLYKILKNYDFKTSNTVEKCACESVFKDNIVVWEINLDKNMTM